MPKARTSVRMAITFHGDHHSGEGKLISRQVSVEPPAPISCVRVSCLWRYTLESIAYTLTLLYHKKRTEYAEGNRDKDMPERYRTGEDTPDSIIGLVWEIIKLKIRR